MDAIFHEKQEGSLCAQHCLNALLQGEYFTPVDLATHAEGLDEVEKQHMAEGGENSEEYRQFLQQPSANMDDSGFFSVQVIASALRVWSLDLIPFSSRDPIAQVAKVNPVNQRAFICNYREHWFTVRKLGNQWFNLNSLLTDPELISDTYLVMFLTQLEQEGYAIFIVNGILPDCDADALLRLVPAVQSVKPTLLSDVKNRCGAATPTTTTHSLEPELEDEQLQAALRLSLEAESLESACETSTTRLSSSSSNSAALKLEDSESLRIKRLAFFGIKPEVPSTISSSINVETKEITTAPQSTSENKNASSEQDDLTEEEMLKAAIEMSMSDETC